MRLLGRLALHVLWRISWILAVTIGWVLFGYRSRGGRNTPMRGPVLIVSNHQSFFDPIIVGMACWRPMHFFARSTLFRGLFGLLIRLYQAFPVERGEADPKAIRKALSLLEIGRMVLMFPEGTRTRTGRMGHIKRGVGMLAEHSGAQVLPVYIHGAHLIWPRGRSLPRIFRRILRVYVGEPMRFEPAKDEPKRAFQERIAAEIERSMLALQDRAYEELPLPVGAADAPEEEPTRDAGDGRPPGEGSGPA